MTRTEFVNQVFKKLEEKHIYLYHDISKEEFEKHKNKFLKNVDALDETHFDAGMLKLFALFKDAHTLYCGVKYDYVKAFITLVDKDFYIKHDGHFKKIEKINGHKIEEVVEKLKELIPYEVETWAYNRAIQLMYCPKAMEMIDCGLNKNQILYICENGEEIVVKLPTPEEAKVQFSQKPFYESKKFSNDEILYVRYRVCADMKDYPFEKFVEDIAKSYKELPKACLVDVRYNTGGSDIVVFPLIDWLKENKIKTYMLMNGSTFSSGTFAVGKFKQELNATLIGTEAGQPTRNYGNIRYEDVDGKEFTYCTRYFELTSCHDKNAPVEYFKGSGLEYFDYAGIIKPDIRIEQKIQDLDQGIDTQLEESLKLIEKEVKKTNEKESE